MKKVLVGILVIVVFSSSPLIFSTWANPCNGDFDCNTDCDGTDAFIIKEDFGRASFNNPCPACVVGDWCVY